MSERESSLFALRRVMPGVEVVKRERPIVAVRTYQGDAPILFALAHARQRVGQRVGDRVAREFTFVPLGFVGRREAGRGSRERRVRALDLRRQSLNDLEATTDECTAGLDESRVQYVARSTIVGIANPRAQQRVALLHHAFVVSDDRGEPRRDGYQQIVDEFATSGRPALDQRKIVGREHCDAKLFGEITPARHRLLVHHDPIPTDGLNRDLDETHPIRVMHLGADDGSRLTRTYQGFVGYSPNRPATGQPRDRLEQAGLAVTVPPRDDRGSGIQTELDLFVTPEVGQPQATEVHVS